MKYARCVIAAGLLLALIAVASRNAPVQADEADFTAIRKQCATFVMSWNKHDAAGMAGIFAEDGDMVGPDGVRHDGRKAVTEALAMWHGPKGPMHASTAKVLDEPVRMITADVAISDAEVLVTGVMGPDGETTSMPMHVTNVWKKAGGKWTLFASRPYVKSTHEE